MIEPDPRHHLKTQFWNGLRKYLDYFSKFISGKSDFSHYLLGWILVEEYF